MEIKSALLNSTELKHLKNSLIIASEKDHKEDWRVKMIEYIDLTSSNEDDEFFYDMIEFTRFLIPDNETTAYTDTNHLIYLNAPGVIGENKRHWDFTYCHECLHQLWDSFKVINRIKKEGIEYNHDLFNIASDCVINDFLANIRKKTIPDNLITPEYIKDKFGIEYNNREDTQYSLYVKLLEKQKEILKDPKVQQSIQQNNSNQQQSQQGNNSNQQQQQQSQQGNNSNQQSQQSNNSSSKDNKNQSSSDQAQDAADQAQDAANQAQDAADKAKKASGKSSKNDDNKSNDSNNKNTSKDDVDNSKDADNKAKEAADKAQEAADKAKEAANEAKDAANEAKEAEKNGDSDKAKEAADKAKEAMNKAKEAMNKAKEAAENAGVDKSELQDGDSDQAGEGSDTHKIEDITKEELEDIKNRAEKTISKYQNKISGAFGEFIKKCESSAKLEKSGLAIQAPKANKGWDDKMNSRIISYTKMQVFQKERLYKKTYQKVKRGSGFIKMGQPITPGKKIRNEKLTINPVFYVDSSGSMSAGNAITHVWDAVYKICEALQKQFSKEKVVDKVSFKLFSFEYDFYEIDYGKRCSAGGGTMAFEQLLKGIIDRSKENLINIIITDGEFSANINEVEKFLKELDGIVIYITNQVHKQGSKIVKQVADKNKEKLTFIEANSTFELD